jgi:hypothetical protein
MYFHLVSSLGLFLGPVNNAPRSDRHSVTKITSPLTGHATNRTTPLTGQALEELAIQLK